MPAVEKTIYVTFKSGVVQTLKKITKIEYKYKTLKPGFYRDDAEGGALTLNAANKLLVKTIEAGTLTATANQPSTDGLTTYSDEKMHLPPRQLTYDQDMVQFTSADLTDADGYTYPMALLDGWGDAEPFRAL